MKNNRQFIQSGAKPKQVIKKITETSYFSFSLHQSKSTIKILKISVFYAIFGHQNGKIPDFKTSVPTLPEFWHMSRQFSQDDVTLM